MKKELKEIKHKEDDIRNQNRNLLDQLEESQMAAINKIYQNTYVFS